MNRRTRLIVLTVAAVAAILAAAVYSRAQSEPTCPMKSGMDKPCPFVPVTGTAKAMFGPKLKELKAELNLTASCPMTGGSASGCQMGAGCAMGGSKAAAVPAKSTDPACGMSISTKDAAGKSQYKGETYYFCSTACKSRFDKNPGQYAK